MSETVTPVWWAGVAGQSACQRSTLESGARGSFAELDPECRALLFPGEESGAGTVAAVLGKAVDGLLWKGRSDLQTHSVLSVRPS